MLCSLITIDRQLPQQQEYMQMRQGKTGREPWYLSMQI